MEVDEKMGIDVYEQIPVMESEMFLLREGRYIREN